MEADTPWFSHREVIAGSATPATSGFPIERHLPWRVYEEYDRQLSIADWQQEYHFVQIANRGARWQPFANPGQQENVWR